MKKILALLFCVFSALALISCSTSTQTEESSVSDIQSSSQIAESIESEIQSSSQTIESIESEEHQHSLTNVKAKDSTCTEFDNINYWTCDCGTYFADALGTQELTDEEVIVAKKDHKLTKTEGIDPTCFEGGILEHWTCSTCSKSFADEACTEELSFSQIFLSQAGHKLTHYEEIPAEGLESGVKEHWYCEYCKAYFADAEATEQITQNDTIIEAKPSYVDFIVEIPTGKDIVVLQLTDTQLIDSSQARTSLSQTYTAHWAPDRLDDLCFNYLTEIITAAKPDFIIITGDLIHGMYDDKGTSLLSLIAYMESWQIPWAPVLGNHDNESNMGADWQCEQLMNAEYCVFDQKTLSGNSNYSVALVQDGEIKRVFYMMDTNAVSAPSEASLANGHTRNDYCGIAPDQIEWYTAQIKELRKHEPNVPISFAYHIQPNVFGEALEEKYGVDMSVNKPNFNIDTYYGKDQTDFGYIGKEMIGQWDRDKKVFNNMKAMGVDSIFVGHVHYNTASVMYEGVRLHYGVKSGEHDRVNAINVTTGEVVEADRVKEGFSPIIGGSIITFSQTDGSLKDIRNYYCSDKYGVIKDGKIDWDRYKSYDVNGLQFGGTDNKVYDGISTISANELWADSALTVKTVEFKGYNAYEVTSNALGKLFVNTSLMRGKTTFTFTVYMENAVGQNEMNPFAIRVKPDDGSGANIAGMYMSGSSQKQYIRYLLNTSVDEVRLELGVWKTYTVNVSDIANGCTEFSFNIAEGNVMYLRDISFS